MYETTDAASNWEVQYSKHLRDTGFKQGLSSPFVFRHEREDIHSVVHGDDLTFLGGGALTYSGAVKCGDIIHNDGSWPPWVPTWETTRPCRSQIAVIKGATKVVTWQQTPDTLSSLSPNSV